MKTLKFLSSFVGIIMAYTALCTLGWGISAWALGSPELGPLTGSFRYGAKFGAALSLLCASATTLAAVIAVHLRRRT